MKHPILNEITETEQRKRYGNVAGDYWTNLTEEEENFMLGVVAGFTRTE